MKSIWSVGCGKPGRRIVGPCSLKLEAANGTVGMNDSDQKMEEILVG